MSERNEYDQTTCGDESSQMIDCTGDACVGDFVEFERATFTGSHRKPKFAGMVTVRGEIIRESYGKEKQQHTFTILLEDGTTTRIKGRNLYANGCRRRRWADETQRRAVLDEKHERGAAARARRDQRLRF